MLVDLRPRVSLLSREGDADGPRLSRGCSDRCDPAGPRQTESDHGQGIDGGCRVAEGEAEGKTESEERDRKRQSNIRTRAAGHDPEATATARQRLADREAERSLSEDQARVRAGTGV